MIEEAVYVGVDVAKSALDVAVTDSAETWQFVNDDEGINQAVHYIASVKPAGSSLRLRVIWKCLWPRLSRPVVCR